MPNDLRHTKQLLGLLNETYYFIVLEIWKQWQIAKLGNFYKNQAQASSIFRSCYNINMHRIVPFQPGSQIFFVG